MTTKRLYMIADFRGDYLERNMNKDPHHPIRCEICWKPLYNNVKNVIVIDDDNFEIPNTEEELNNASHTARIGPKCYTMLRKYSKIYGFIVKLKKG